MRVRSQASLAQTEEETAVLTEEILLAAIDEACECQVEEETEENTEEGGGEELSDEEEEEKVAPGRCISQLSKLRRSLKNLSFFGLIDESLDLKAFVKGEKKECRQARRENHLDRTGRCRAAERQRVAASQDPGLDAGFHSRRHGPGCGARKRPCHR